MEHFIGIDVHKTSCTFAVVGPKGKKIRTDVVETNGRALIEYVKGLSGKKRICLEEGTQARWVYELLKPHATEVAVVNVRQKHDNKNDRLDAFALAEDYRLGKFKNSVYKEHGAFGALQAHARLYTKIVRDHVRVQLRLGSMARARGISYSSSSERDDFVKALPSYQQAAAQTLLLELDALGQVRERAEEELERQVGKHKISKVLLTAPGFGKKRVAQLIAVVVDPHRFSHKRKFWSYCGFAVRTRSSSDWRRSNGDWQRKQTTLTRGLNPAHNAIMKDVFKGAAKTIIDSKNPNEPLYSDYLRLLEQTNPPLAALTIARKLAAIVLTMWKKEEAYKPSEYRRAKNSAS